MWWICCLVPLLAAEPETAPSEREERPAQRLAPDLSFLADVALAWFTADEPDQRGAHDPRRNGFTLQQLELAVSDAVDPYLRFDANIVFSEFGVEVEEVYATTLALPLASQLRAGQFLTRFGRTNATHPHAWHFVDQPLAVGRVFGGEGNRGVGVEASVLLPLPWFAEVLVSETHPGGEATARSFSGVGVRSPLDLQTTVAVEQYHALGADVGVSWGLSWASGPNATGRHNRSEVYGADLFVKYRRPAGGGAELGLETEWLYRRRQVPEDVLSDLNGFTQVSWRLSRRWGLAARHELGTAAWDLSGVAVVDPLDPEWTGTRQRWSTAVTFWPTEFSRIRLQGASDLAPWEDAPVFAAFLALEFAVGAHGAHTY